MKRKRLLYILSAWAVVAGALCWMYVPSGGAHRRACVCRVMARSCYALPLGGGDTLYLSLRADSLQDAAVAADSVAEVADISGVFVSQEGHVVTTDSLMQGCPDVLPISHLRQRLVRLDTLLARRVEAEKDEREGLDEYARTHSVADDGYNEVMAYRETVGARAVAVDSAWRLVKRARELARPAACLHTVFSVRAGGAQGAWEAVGVARANGLCLIQLKGKCLPEGCARFSVHRFGAYAAGAELWAHNDFGGVTADDSVWRVTRSDTLLPATEGGAWVNASGNLCGVERGGRRVSSWKLAGLLRHVHSWPSWWGHNVSAWVSGLFHKYGKASSPVSLKKNGGGLCVRIFLPDTSRYEGQAVLERKREKGKGNGLAYRREGYGRLTLRDGTVYTGIWHADTLSSGRRMAGGDVYEGNFNARMLPDGSGIYWGRDGERYSGQWKAGLRDGHGFSSQAGRMVRCGEWRRGRFRGERMVCTADRVYGIDISRYQHGRGRKYYPIDWSRLRITGLGVGRRVQGNVDYPVSFLYIKATEGRSLFNKYYSADLRQARRHGIPVGSYHFFSPASTGAQQAAYFLKMAWIAPRDLPPVLDLEPTERQVRQMGGDAAMFREVMVWLQTVERKRGKRPVLYVGQQFVNNHLKNAPASLRGYDVWVARYGEFKPYVRLLHWQLTPYGRVRGIKGEVDINVYNGTREQFDDYLKSH